MSSLGPILPGRIPNSLSLSRLIDRLRTNNTELARLQDQAATGQRFTTPGEDPAAAIRTIALQSQIERRTQLRNNVSSARSSLQLAEASLGTIGDGLNRAKTLILAGTGGIISQEERNVVADELADVIDGLLASANAKFGDRYLFGGSQSSKAPFERLDSGVIRYNGDTLATRTFVDVDSLLATNVDGATAFGALNTVAGSDIDPALTLDTKLADLRGGTGVPLGAIELVVDDGTNPAQTATVDLTGARTVGDIKTRLEAALAAGPATITVDVDPASNNGLRIQQSGGAAGTVTVNDLAGSRVARDLGIAGTGVAVNGGDLDPRLSLTTTLASLNAGTGIGPTVGNGLQITSGDRAAIVDLDGAVTIEDLLERIEATGLDVDASIDDTGTSLAISSRRSGESFSIGENNGTNATLLGIRSLTAETSLAQLNFGSGIPNHETDLAGNPIPANLSITRRDGTTTTVDLAGLTTVQKVLDAINVVDANLTATLNSVGNGISIDDTSGPGPLVIESNAVADALGIAGTQAAPGPLTGGDVNPRESAGLFDTLLRIEAALRSDDRPTLARLDANLNVVNRQFTASRGDLGSRLRSLEQTENRLLDEDTLLQQTLSEVFDADLAEVIARLTSVQTTLQATLQIAASTSQLTVLSFL